MATNVHIKKSSTENGVVTLKKFTRKVQETGIIPKVKSQRYATRAKSKLTNKKDKLIKLESAKKYETLKKMGKLQVKTYRPAPSPVLNTTTEKKA